MAENEILKGIFPEGFIGSAVELGAGDGVTLSITLELEKAGWKVLCIEPCEWMYEKCKQARANVVRAAVMDVSLKNVELIVRTVPGCANNDTLSTVGGLNQYFIQTFETHNLAMTDSSIEFVRQERLDVLLEEAGFESLDLATIDVDGEEMKVLAGFEIERWKPKAVMIENVTDDQEMRVWFRKRGYNLHVHQLPNDLYLEA